MASTGADTIGFPVGTYIVGGLVMLGLSETVAAPMVTAFLVSAVIYNGIQLWKRKPLPKIDYGTGIPLPSAPFTGGGGGSFGGGGASGDFSLAPIPAAAPPVPADLTHVNRAN